MRYTELSDPEKYIVGLLTEIDLCRPEALAQETVRLHELRLRMSGGPRSEC